MRERERESEREKEREEGERVVSIVVLKRKSILHYSSNLINILANAALLTILHFNKRHVDKFCTHITS